MSGILCLVVDTQCERDCNIWGGGGGGAGKMLGWLQHMTWVCSAHRREGEERIYLLFSTNAGL